MRLISKKGFYLVSPFLGFFFFLIAVSIAAFFIAENNQQTETAKAGIGTGLIFSTFAIQTDVEDVFFQNYLQEILDRYHVGDPAEDPIATQITNDVTIALSNDLRSIYTQLYQDLFGIECDSDDTAWSAVFVTFNGQRNVILLKDLNLDEWARSFSPRMRTAIWPLASRYSLVCNSVEPPITIEIDFKSRWYYLDASCICCQAPGACGIETVDPKTFEECVTVSTCKPDL